MLALVACLQVGEGKGKSKGKGKKNSALTGLE
jgi:hypothetical protein